jgi:hypothetical protein
VLGCINVCYMLSMTAIHPFNREKEFYSFLNKTQIAKIA